MTRPPHGDRPPDDRIVTPARGAIDDAPLAALFPHLPARDVEALRQVARAVDAVRAEGATTPWEWTRDPVVTPEPLPWTSVLFGVNFIEHAGAGDQLEFVLQVVWTESGELAVEAAVNVACWCEDDHATHDVDELSLVVGARDSLVPAFTAGAERLGGWLADPRDADHWREVAALPPRRP
ncbi:hypothetical protein ACIP2X_05605 [Streptomyces sp. NPDC089424]|uniref:hypothetical protein n=1 Tax=Streptomyces sp. NPDC089424 TaxID=3365917 RepID=UPI0038253933